MRTFFTLLSLLLFTSVHAAIEPKTGISFPDKYMGSNLDSVGVRKIGPIKVYAVGKYSDTFLLKMNMGVTAEKIATSTAKAIRPRCGDKESVEEFEKCLIGGLPDGCGKGTKLAFVTGGGKLTICVNDKEVGQIKSGPLAKAFAGIYTDKNAVLTLEPVDE
mmetsp:Transcript_20494/g.29644  ORF Transcript_20494/g.29644 Transcript_20494/m.29644 type:complete len:161 (-) Transcript_20494:88-570(-)|eukprot:CAMPEP_0202473742 /NCGR_PEP_ID=MMETSP1360-20130828/91885_1 /ASSEMBLY_ACC=CAM_ASM_000848 /TAXON_ID=515479 /ORGANISM="Licmophora paradoxa, Strain CCMP2313" /LENGTH=160 /DNA_ID=CAMNT_0049100785 /DNA_START=106 /DNA_END=588 /DNA_ORIENTATION=-